MFREMRRSKRKMNDEIAYQLLEEGIDGVLGTVGENGYPYAVPVNYVLLNNKIYFHSATEGHKIDNIKFNNKVSFTVIAKNEVLQREFSTEFKSVIAFGKAKLVEANKEILMEIIKKYSLPFLTEGNDYVNSSYSHTQIVEIEIQHISGKERTQS